MIDHISNNIFCFLTKGFERSGKPYPLADFDKILGTKYVLPYPGIAEG